MTLLINTDFIKAPIYRNSFIEELSKSELVEIIRGAGVSTGLGVYGHSQEMAIPFIIKHFESKHAIKLELITAFVDEVQQKTIFHFKKLL